MVLFVLLPLMRVKRRSSRLANVEAMIQADRKITALKQLQDHIRRTGFQNNELEGVVFEDVPEALERWHASGIKISSFNSLFFLFYASYVGAGAFTFELRLLPRV